MQKMGKGAFSSSTKVDAVVERVQSVIEGSKTAKIIIFSQYRAMIDLVSYSRIASPRTAHPSNPTPNPTPLSVVSVSHPHHL